VKTLAAELTRTHGLAIDNIAASAAEAARILQLAGYTIPESTVMA